MAQEHAATATTAWFTIPLFIASHGQIHGVFVAIDGARSQRLRLVDGSSLADGEPMFRGIHSDLHILGPDVWFQAFGLQQTHRHTGTRTLYLRHTLLEKERKRMEQKESCTKAECVGDFIHLQRVSVVCDIWRWFDRGEEQRVEMVTEDSHSKCGVCEFCRTLLTSSCFPLPPPSPLKCVLNEHTLSPGHQFTSFAMDSTAGTNVVRMINVSTSTATTRMNPVWFRLVICDSNSPQKAMPIMSPAAVMMLPVLNTPRIMAS